MTAVIQVERLTRRFRSIIAVDGVTFCVEEGEVFGGTGAGKTTTVSRRATRRIIQSP